MHVYFLIDRSGSMETRWGETLGAVNGYASMLRDGEGAANTRMNVAFFDGNEPFAVARAGQSLDAWKDLTDADATPRGMTPLYDAIGQLSGLVAGDKPEKATVVIVTDGAENASKETTQKGALATLKRMEKQGFDIVFLGADFDAISQAARVGRSRDQTLNMTEGNYDEAMGVLASRTRKYASTGKVASFTESERKKARGE